MAKAKTQERGGGCYESVITLESKAVMDARMWTLA